MSVRVSVILDRKGADVVTIGRDTGLTDALKALAEHNIGALVVSDHAGRISGIISERDIVRRLAGLGSATLDLTVADVMTANVRTCTLDATADEVMQVMTTQRARHLPVLDDEGQLAGIVSIGDVVKSRIDDLETQARSLHDYITGSPL
jgi:CBS domain-containing protein